MGKDKVILISVEETKKEISRKAALGSDLIADMLQDDDDELPHIPLPNVTAKSLIVIADFLERHANDPVPVHEGLVPSNDIDDIREFPPWARGFVKSMEIDQLVDTFNAANFVDCKPLLGLCAAYVACQIKGKEPREIWEWAGIPKDAFPTPAEEAEIERQNLWVWNLPQPKAEA
jgi:hypothetical protein